MDSFCLLDDLGRSQGFSPVYDADPRVYPGPETPSRGLMQEDMMMDLLSEFLSIDEGGYPPPDGFFCDGVTEQGSNVQVAQGNAELNMIPSIQCAGFDIHGRTLQPEGGSPSSGTTCSSGSPSSIADSEPARSVENGNKSSRSGPPATKRKRRRRKAPRPSLPHGVVEQNYRKKLNTHIEELRAVIPTIKENGEANARDDLAKGLSSTHKTNKATVYAKAVEYIQHLEAKCLSSPS